MKMIHLLLWVSVVVLIVDSATTLFPLSLSSLSPLASSLSPLASTALPLPTASLTSLSPTAAPSTTTRPATSSPLSTPSILPTITLTLSPLFLSPSMAPSPPMPPSSPPTSTPSMPPSTSPSLTPSIAPSSSPPSSSSPSIAPSLSSSSSTSPSIAPSSSSSSLVPSPSPSSLSPSSSSALSSSTSTSSPSTAPSPSLPSSSSSPSPFKAAIGEYSPTSPHISNTTTTMVSSPISLTYNEATPTSVMADYSTSSTNEYLSSTQLIMIGGIGGSLCLIIMVLVCVLLVRCRTTRSKEAHKDAMAGLVYNNNFHRRTGSQDPNISRKANESSIDYESLANNDYDCSGVHRQSPTSNKPPRPSVISEGEYISYPPDLHEAMTGRPLYDVVHSAEDDVSARPEIITGLPTRKRTQYLSANKHSAKSRSVSPTTADDIAAVDNGVVVAGVPGHQYAAVSKFQRPSVISERLSITSEQPSITSEQLSITSIQPSIMSERSTSDTSENEYLNCRDTPVATIAEPLFEVVERDPSLPLSHSQAHQKETFSFPLGRFSESLSVDADDDSTSEYEYTSEYIRCPADVVAMAGREVYAVVEPDRTVLVERPHIITGTPVLIRDTHM